MYADHKERLSSCSFLTPQRHRASRRAAAPQTGMGRAALLRAEEQTDVIYGINTLGFIR